jgi:hypothetical protein
MLLLYDCSMNCANCEVPHYVIFFFIPLLALRFFLISEYSDWQPLTMSITEQNMSPIMPQVRLKRSWTRRIVSCRSGSDLRGMQFKILFSQKYYFLHYDCDFVSVFPVDMHYCLLFIFLSILNIPSTEYNCMKCTSNTG